MNFIADLLITYYYRQYIFIISPFSSNVNETKKVPVRVLRTGKYGEKTYCPKTQNGFGQTVCAR